MVRTLECPNCGGTVQLKYERTINAVCIQCLSILDARTSSLEILQRFASQQRVQPLIPLGTRGKLSGGEYEAIGFQVRSINVEGIVYSWAEYLLYNPYKGYRYLTEYNGHWNDIRTLRALPMFTGSGTKQAVSYRGEIYKHFQTAQAQTSFVMGEFPWQIRVGETVQAKDYIRPPAVISAEETPDEVVWSLGRYIPGKEIWNAFKLKGSPPPAAGIYANQPSPFAGRPASAWLVFALLTTLLLTTLVVVAVAAPRQEVFRQSYTFSTATGEPSFVTPVFELNGGKSNVEVSIRTDLNNDWALLSFALINDDTGEAYDFAREVSYYSGRDSDGSWSEGSRSESLSIPDIPDGRYYLRVEPGMETDGRRHAMQYELALIRGSPSYFWFLLGFIGLLIPPVLTSIRAFSFENRRWAESDYGPLLQYSSGDDDD